MILSAIFIITMLQVIICLFHNLQILLKKYFYRDLSDLHFLYGYTKYIHKNSREY